MLNLVAAFLAVALPPPDAPGPWGNDLLMYRVSSGLQVKQTFTSRRCVDAALKKIVRRSPATPWIISMNPECISASKGALALDFRNQWTKLRVLLQGIADAELARGPRESFDLDIWRVVSDPAL